MPFMLLSFWDGILDFFISLANLVHKGISGIIEFFTMIPTFVTTLTTSLGLLPDFLFVFGYISITLAILFLVINFLTSIL